MPLMERIGIRELRQHASRYLDQVRAGNTIEVTDRGVLVALLVPPSPAQTSRDRLVAEGRIRPGTGALRLPARRPVPTGTTAEVLDDLRNER
jgi:prevent-host-death family protein